MVIRVLCVLSYLYKFEQYLCETLFFLVEVIVGFGQAFCEIYVEVTCFYFQLGFVSLSH